MASLTPAIIYGAASVAQLGAEEIKELFGVLEQHSVKSLDTAWLYVRRLSSLRRDLVQSNQRHLQTASEVTLGKFDAPKKFAIHTKAPAMGANAMGKQNMLDGMEKSLKELKVDSVRMSNTRCCHHKC